MAKYSFEFKLQLVKEYENGHEGLRTVAKRHGIHHHNLEKWVAIYRQYGEDGLVRRRQAQTYSFEYKLHVVELYLSSELSYQELALQVGMTNPAQIARWVMDYRTAGPEALKPRKRGRKRTVDKEKSIREIEEGDSDEQKNLLKQLQEENLKLRIENTFLKELSGLRLEEEAHRNK